MDIQCLIGIACNDFCMLAADMSKLHSIIIMKKDDDKIHHMSDNLVMGVIGKSGDIDQFTPYIDRNIQLYRIRNQYPMSLKAAVHFTSRALEEGFKSGSPYEINLLMGGYEEMKGQLYYLDFFATCIKVPFAAHGLGGLFTVGILENHYRPTLMVEEAYEVMKACVREIHTRFVINLTDFQVKVVSKSGVQVLPVISPFSLAE